MNEMNIVLAPDKEYVVPTMVTISSILSSANADIRCHVFILCTKELGTDDRELIRDIERKYDQADIIFVEIDDARLGSAATTAYISAASYHRLYISSLIPVDRCLYIDGDMIVQEDLSDVYGIDLEGCYAAGVRDMGVQCHLSEYRQHARYLDIPDMDTYVNAGFLILDLERIRADGIGQRLIRAIDAGYKYMDQDIINKICYGRIKLLPLRYDLFTVYHGSLSGLDLSGYAPEELDGIGHGAAVYHFVGTFKPWSCTRLAINQIWWDEARKILDPQLYSHMLEQARIAEHKSDWEYITDVARDREHIVVFGCSRIGSEVAEGLTRDRGGRTIVFADNDAGKVGRTVGGFRVLSAKEARSSYPDALYVISSQNGFRQIGAQLARSGVAEEDIVRYVHKDDAYLRGLDARFIEHEERQLRWCGRR